MMSKWESYSRAGINAASTATSLGFSAAKFGTKLGFGFARGVTTTVVSIAGYPFGVGPFLGGAVSVAFSLAEQVALAPILIGETLTSTSLVAASSSIDVLSAIFPGSDEASFSLASFVTLVKREWNEPALWETLPKDRYSVADIAKALVAWGALQGVTHEWKENEWWKVLREMNVQEEIDDDLPDVRERRESRIRITSDLSSQDVGQIITADIEDLPGPSNSHPPTSTLKVNPTLARERENIRNRVSQSRLKSDLRRLSKMVLAGYGGAGLIFFGVSLTPPLPGPVPTKPNPLHANANTPEENLLADVVDASQREASLTASNLESVPTSGSETAPKYSWWNVLLGRHDKEIFEEYAFTPATVRDPKDKDTIRKSRRSFLSSKAEKPISATIGAERYMPRFWVLTDHGRRQVVLVFRGTMSLNELAVDLTCDPAPFLPASAEDPWEEEPPSAPQSTIVKDEDLMPMPGSMPFPTKSTSPSSSKRSSRRFSRASSTSFVTDDGQEVYFVHGGMLRMARVMGEIGRPVHVAVQQALYKNKGYELILTGHSLGAGVAALLALIWADSETCLTVPSSGLPVGRRVSAYIFAPPCLVSPSLSRRSRKLITSFTYAHDIVSRLSLGSVRDMNRVAAWLCEANKGQAGAEGTENKDEGYAAVTKRAMKFRAGYGSDEDPDWFLSVRKTLEANMVIADLFPPGRALWAVRDGDLMPNHRSNPEAGDDATKSKVRLFEVEDVEKFFGQIIFARDMLSSHLPHQYDRVLHELL